MVNRDKIFNKLLEKNGSFYVNRGKDFKPVLSVNEYIPQVINWAFSQKHFKENGRDRKTILKNAVLGKFGEFAIYKFLKSKGYELDEPDHTSIRDKGEWDSGDLFLDSKKIQVKTSHSGSNLLMLKKKEWDKDGNYLYQSSDEKNYSVFFFCRMKPSLKDVLTLEDREDYNKDEIIESLSSVNFRFDIPGFININDFRKIISQDHSIKKGDLLNGKEFKDDVYYCQAGDLRDALDIPKKK